MNQLTTFVRPTFRPLVFSRHVSLQIPATALIKDYSEVPKVRGLPIIGTALDYTRDQFKGKPFIMPLERQKLYGNIYRERPMPNGPEFLVTLDPSDVEKVFRVDGKEPHRPTFSVFDEARKVAKQQRGLVLTQGKDWTDLRRPISKYMLTPPTVQEYVPQFNQIVADFVQFLKQQKNGQDQVVDNVASSCFRLTHECINQFLLGERANVLGDSYKEDHLRVLNSIQGFLSLAGEMLFELPLYMIYQTKKWKAAVNSQNEAIQGMTNIVAKRMNQVMANDNGENNLLTHMLQSGFDPETIVHNSVSLTVAGVDSTSFTLLFTLYCLAKNPHMQDQLREEINSAWGDSKTLSMAQINNMKLLSNCIKEAQRLYPAAPFNARVIKQDLLLSGYQVPKGTTVLMPFYAMGRMSQWFENPEEYDPHRWSREDKAVSRFASLPFGFGARMCIGKRIAELQLKMSIAYLMKNFKVEYPLAEPFGIVQNVFLNADREVPMRFEDI